MSQDFISGRKNEMLEKEPERPVHCCEGRAHWGAFSSERLAKIGSEAKEKTQKTGLQFTRRVTTKTKPFYCKIQIKG